MEFSLCFFILNVLVIAIWPALLEIWMEEDKGWGADLPKDTWYGKIIGENNPFMMLLAKTIGVPYFFGYAIFMYFFLVPAVLLLEYSFFLHDGFFILAVYFAVLAVEDFLWFVLNPYFSSLRELLKGPYGSIWWHKRWVKVSKNAYFPSSYFSSLLLVIIFLLLSYFL